LGVAGHRGWWRNRSSWSFCFEERGWGDFGSDVEVGEKLE